MDSVSGPVGVGPAPRMEGVALEIRAVEVLNYAFYHNGFEVIRGVSIANSSGKDLSGCSLSFSSSPGFVRPASVPVPDVPDGSVVEVDASGALIDAACLAGLAEAENGRIDCVLERNGEMLCSGSAEIRLLPMDQWAGTGFFPQVISSFVLPNDPSLARLKRRASDFLAEWGAGPELDGYLCDDRDRIRLQAAAAFKALQEKNLVYVLPPISFEEIGQRIRLCHSVLEQRMGTCIDLALAYASLLESMGLNPLIVFCRNHAFAGFWLEDETFPDAVLDDASVLTKRVADGVNRIVVVECTGLTVGGASFDKACSMAASHLAGDDFELVVDVRRARLSKVRPLPVVMSGDSGKWIVDVEDLPGGDLSAAPSSPIPQRVTEKDLEPGAPLTKIAQWERRLLDLGMRNQLVNLRRSRNLVPLLISPVDDFEDELSRKSEFSVMPVPDDWPVPPEMLDFETICSMKGSQDLVVSEFGNGRLRSSLPASELEKSIVSLYRASRTSIEENGVNNAYVVLGLLRWYEAAKPKTPRYAPILMIPVEIVRKSARIGYVVRMRDDDSMINETLLEKLRQDFGISVGGLDPVPQDAHGADTRRIFSIVRTAVMDRPGWDVLESACLGVFSFSGFMMWNDVRNRSGELARSKIVSSLMSGRLSWSAGPMDSRSAVSEEGVLLPIPADASQIHAIKAAVRGESFVLHGPPGTGKSQTITAMIANLLAGGKTVLFAAEKMAALEVVQKRLEKIGLGPFCLELHSNKAKKRAVLEQLKRAAESSDAVRVNYEAKAAETAALRRRLDAYSEELHRTRPFGMSLYEAVDSFERLSSAPDLPSAIGPESLPDTGERLAEMRGLVEDLSCSAAAVSGVPGGLGLHPLSRVGLDSYSMELRMLVPPLLSSYKSALAGLASSASSFSVSAGLTPPSSMADLENMAELAGCLSKWVGMPSEWASFPGPPSFFGDMSAMASAFSESLLAEERLGGAWERGLLDVDPEPLCRRFSSLSGSLGVPLESLSPDLESAFLDVYRSASELSRAIGVRPPRSRGELDRLFLEARELEIWLPFPRSWIEDGDRDRSARFSAIAEMCRSYERADGLRKRLSEVWEEGFFELDGASLLAGLQSAERSWFIPKMFGSISLSMKLGRFSKRPVPKEKFREHLSDLAVMRREMDRGDSILASFDDDLSGLLGEDGKDWGGLLNSMNEAEMSISRLSADPEALAVVKKYAGVRSVALSAGSFKRAFSALRPPAGLSFDAMLGLCEICESLSPFAKGRFSFSGMGSALMSLKAWRSSSIKSSGLFGRIGKMVPEPRPSSPGEWDSLASMALEAERCSAFMRKLTGGDDFRLRAGRGGLIPATVPMLDAFESFRAARDQLFDLLRISASFAPGESPADQIALCDAIGGNLGLLKGWTAWNRAARKAEEAGLGPVVEACRRGVGADELPDAFEKAICMSLALSVVKSSETLSGFAGASFNVMVERFRRLDGELEALAVREICFRLAKNVPNFTVEAAQSSEIGILQKAIRSGGRGVGIRSLFERIPNLLPRLCPCMMMSPISAAQYLAPDCPPFDMVVFDEASQLQTCRAVGVMARAKNAVVVGDPNQMPPTSFFSASYSDEDNVDVEDLDSVLDDCLALSMPQTSLLWHYRSRHESLIAFSNMKFYGNRLLTFPSSNDLEEKVRLVPVKGVFERSAGRRNVPEAKAIVAELVRRAHDAALSRFSVGVVTFNAQQQNLVEDLINEACRSDSVFEKWVYEPKDHEPLFVKNLENVQGDERDVIVFSIAFGPDANGKVSMNFGPLNREGGWRRLNVAVSRARHEMIVFSSMKPDDIDLSRTRSRGVAALRDFLEYASGGRLSAPVSDRSGLVFRKCFEAESLSSALEERGYKCRTGVGRSGYRVDVGVMDPKRPGRYLLGILFDGSNYRDARTTRDRELAQVSVLRGLGWRITRIWTMDWLEDRNGEIERVVSEIERACLEPEPAESVSEPSIPYEPEPLPETDSESEGPSLQETDVAVSGGVPYRAAVLPVMPVRQDYFSYSFYDEELSGRIDSVMAVEAPVSERLLGKRIIDGFGISRMTAKAQSRLRMEYERKGLKFTEQPSGRFFWRDDQDSGSYGLYRTSGSGADRREASDVPLREALNAVVEVVGDQIGLPVSDAVREAARRLGYSRLGSVITSLIEGAIESAVSEGLLRIERGRLSMPLNSIPLNRR